MKDFITTFKSCISDASYNALLDENNRIKKKIADDKNDGLEVTYVPTIPIIFIAILYVILFSFIGIFYITSLTQSIGKIIDSDPSFLDYQYSYPEIIKCLNLNRFVLFIIVFIAIFVSNVYIIYTFIWKGKHIKQAMKIVSISITSVVGITFLLCNNPSFIKIFENTIGYAITKMFSPNRNYSFSDVLSTLSASIIEIWLQNLIFLTSLCQMLFFLKYSLNYYPSKTFVNLTQQCAIKIGGMFSWNSLHLNIVFFLGIDIGFLVLI
jgi:hypothetical protein